MIEASVGQIYFTLICIKSYVTQLIDVKTPNVNPKCNK